MTFSRDYFDRLSDDKKAVLRKCGMPLDINEVFDMDDLRFYDLLYEDHDELSDNEYDLWLELSAKIKNIRDEVKNKKNRVWSTVEQEAKRNRWSGHDYKSDNGSDKNKNQDDKSETKSAFILRLAKARILELFTDQFNEAYAAIRIDSHIEVLRVKDTRFDNWLSKIFYMEKKSALGNETINAVKSVISAEADFDGLQRKLNLRVGSVITEKEGQTKNIVLYYDLANKDWSVVKITNDNWEIDLNPPIIFKRYNSNGAQITPSKTYPPDIFDQFISMINIKDEKQKLLLKCYIVSLFVADIPKPAQMLHGAQGSAKTSEQEAIKDLVDPSPMLTLTFPKDINELIQKLMHNYVCYFDNISVIPAWVSDELCRAVTGSGFSKRGLFTDDDDVIYSFRRCIGFNGVNLAATKADLLDRGFITQLERIPKEDRLKEAEVKAKFAAIKPQLLGYIFDILVKVLRVKSNGGISVNEYPRMADFAETGEIISRCMGYREDEFLKAYYDNINLITDEAIEANPVAAAILELMTTTGELDHNGNRRFMGKPTELFEQLNLIAEQLKIDTKIKT